MQSESLPSPSLIGKNPLSGMWLMWWLGIALGMIGVFVLHSSVHTVVVFVGRAILIFILIVYLLVFIFLSMMTYTVELGTGGISIEPRMSGRWNWLFQKRFEKKRLTVKGIRRITKTKVLLRIHGWHSILVTGAPRDIDRLLKQFVKVG